jgi:hypothetical protein
MDANITAVSARRSTITFSVALLVLSEACAAPESPNTPAWTGSEAGGSIGPSNGNTGQGASDAGGTPREMDASMSLPPPAPPSSYDVAKTFVGAYAGIIKFRKIQSLGALGSMHALATIYATINVKDDSTNKVVMLSTNACRVEIGGAGTGALSGASFGLPDVIMTTTHLDDAMFSASKEGNGVAWSVSEIHGPIGWMWSSPSDAIPTSATDSRVFDQDSDGHPGVTMTVTGGGASAAVYFVQVQRDVLSGTVAANGDLVGTTADTSDQKIIGSDNALVNAASVSWSSDPNTADNTARLVRVPASLTCQQLIAQLSTLFQ